MLRAARGTVVCRFFRVVVFRAFVLRAFVVLEQRRLRVAASSALVIDQPRPFHSRRVPVSDPDDPMTRVQLH